MQAAFKVTNEVETQLLVKHAVLAANLDAEKRLATERLAFAAVAEEHERQAVETERARMAAETARWQAQMERREAELRRELDEERSRWRQEREELVHRHKCELDEARASAASAVRREQERYRTMRAYYENVLLEQREEASNQRLAEAEKARKALEEALEEARIAHEAELRAVLQRSSQLSPAGDGRSGKLKAPVATESAGQAPTLQAAESDFGAGTSGDTAAADIFVPNNGPASEAPASPALTIPGHSSARTKDAQRKRPREDGRTSDRASGTKTPLDRHQDIERVLVDKPNQKLFYRIGKADTGGSACDEILSKAFVPIDPNMVHLRGSTYAAARRVVLYERGRNGEEVVLAAAVIRLQTKHLEVLILVVAKPERKKGYGRILVEALTQVGREDSCTLLVAWASPDSKDFWPKVEMFEKGAADSSLKSAIMEYQQAESTIGFSGSKMVAKLIKI
jgi:GNAT superfamily N-acetyltransferase